MVTEYALTSAQDFSNPDPGAWHLLASNDDGRSWTVLDIQTNQTFNERSQRRLFSIRNRMAYNTYRLQVDTTADVALAELELIGPLAGATNEVDLQALVSASGEQTLIGPATQAFDGDPSTKWIDFGTGESKARWIQCQYTFQNEMVVSNISQFLVIARRMATRNRLLDKAPEILSKLSARANLPVRPLTGYALTSANDAPVRDPRDWKLLGSNDGGKIWRILDVRRNESFARRFQRRAFTLSKEAACALYRLQIDSIRTPGAAEADSVQLAEIEPLYAANGPKGRFSVVVSAQGENPPMELAEKAFDGDVRTKWLDFGEAPGAKKSGSNTNRSSWIQWQYLADADLPVISLRWLRAIRTRPPQPVMLQMEGVVVAWSPATKILGLLDETGFQLFELDSPVGQLRLGEWIRLSGQPRFGADIPIVVKPEVVSLGSLPVVTEVLAEQAFNEREHFLRGAAEGRVTSVSEEPSYSDLRLVPEKGSGYLIAKVFNPGHARTALFSGCRLRVQGVVQPVFNGSGKRVAGVIWVPGFDQVTLAAPTAAPKEQTDAEEATVGVDPHQPVTEIRQIYDLIQSQPGKVFPVRLRGVITYIDLGLGYFYLQDGRDGILVNGLLGAGLAPFLHQEGLYIELQGEIATNEPAINATAVVKVLGRGRMPEPTRPSWDYLMTGRDFSQWVEAEGMVREVSEHRLVVVVPGGRLVVWINELDKSSGNNLLGSLVRVCGVCAPVANNRNVRLGIRLLVPSMEHVQVLKAVPDNPFDLQAQPIARLLRWGTQRTAQGIQLAKTTGVVTYSEPRLLFVQDRESGLRVSLRDDALVEPGDQVELVGFAEPDGLSPKLVQARVRKVGRSPLSPPNSIDLLDPDSSGPDATRRQIEATLLGRRANESYQILELRDERTEMAFSAFFPTIHGILPSLPLGSRLRLQGVFKAEMDDLPDFGQAITSFRV